MKKPEKHLFICGSFRNGSVSGVCAKKASDLFQYFSQEAEDRGLDMMVSNTGCMNLCVHGPVAVLYPEGQWFKSLTEEVADTILGACRTLTSINKLDSLKSDLSGFDFSPRCFDGENWLIFSENGLSPTGS